MNYRFTDLVDIDRFRRMLKSFYEATGILHGLVDAENNVISAIGWQEACTDFHRQHPCSNERCLESNRYLAEHLGEGAFVGFRCKNGLMDYATPIIIEGQQLATLYFGQLLHEAADMDFFHHQAEECGFEVESYLAAIRKVPVIPRERIGPIMDFYVQLAQMLARGGLDRIKQREAEQRLVDLNRDLAHLVEERTVELETKNNSLRAEIIERRWTEQALHYSQTQLQAILDSSPVGVGWSDVDSNIEYINQKFIDLFGYTLEDIPTLEHWYRLAYPDDALRNEIVGTWKSRVDLARELGAKIPDLEAPIVCKDGSVRHVIISVSWVGERRLVNFSDISDRWLVEQREHARNAILESIATGASFQQILHAIVGIVEVEEPGMICSILLIDRDGKHLNVGAAPGLPEFYNQAIDGLEIGDGVGSCGTAAATMKRVIVTDIATHPYWAKFTQLAAQAELAACWSEPILSSKSRLLGTFALYHRQPCAPDDSDLQLIGHATNLASIAIEHHLADQELERQAHTDYLTELANRRYFMAQAEAELVRAERYHKPLSLLMLDIDHFKAVNDNHGHKTGDMVLQKLAAVLRHILREVDIIGRLGGEEFAVILPETGSDEAREAAERLRKAIEDTDIQTDTGEFLRITVSIGVGTLDKATTNIETLLKQADDALYAAKHNGRNQVQMVSGSTPPRQEESIAANFFKLSWHTDYECHHRLIDAQHRSLFNHANQLLDEIAMACPAEQLLTTIKALIGEIAQHFQDEEAIFTQSGFPDARSHISSHKQLADKANLLLKHFNTESLSISELQHFIVHELIAEHMLKEDREFFLYLQLGHKSTPP
jgi:diguanylate cyclase (GGDEF)-like protein/hemerythrin-like metal-binding protein/PAS domain S-box-containing protein